VRIFNRESNQVDPMVYLSHHGNCFCFDEPTTTSPGWNNEKVRTNQAQVDIFKFAEVRDENTIHTTQWGVTCDRRSTRLRRLSVTGLIVIYNDVMYTAKESWIRDKHVYLLVLCLRIEIISVRIYVYFAHRGSEPVPGNNDCWIISRIMEIVSMNPPPRHPEFGVRKK
jgi:hypothetical protein